MDLSTAPQPPGTHHRRPSAPSPSALAPPVPAAPPDPDVASSDPLDALLKQIIGGWFLLTDGQGAVSKWSEPAELLFGKESPDALGHSFFEDLLTGPLSGDAEQWRRFVVAGDTPQARALVEVTGRHAPSGETFPLEAVFVPVKLDEGFDFSLFLEDLAFELPMNLMLLRMRQQHPVVVRALRAALSEEADAWDGWRTAGTMVAFRPLGPTPWVQEVLARREEDRAVQDAEREEAINSHDPGVHGDSIQDLDDAAAVVARLLSALERIDGLERAAQQARTGLEQLDAGSGVAAAPNPAAESERIELLARLERLERAGYHRNAERAEESAVARAALVERLERLERERLESGAAVQVRLTAALGEADARAAAARAELEGRLAELIAA